MLFRSSASLFWLHYLLLCLPLAIHLLGNSGRKDARVRVGAVLAVAAIVIASGNRSPDWVELEVLGIEAGLLALFALGLRDFRDQAS